MSLARVLLLTWLGPVVANAEDLPLPVPLESVAAPLRAACPECIEPGFLPCGSPDVQYGRRFAATAMQGTPPRAYLLARAPTRKELLDVVVGAPADAVTAAMTKVVADLRLVVLEDGWRSVRVLAPSDATRIVADPAQLACFHERPRDLGCCLGDGPADRGCLPKADPPSATLRFEDAVAGETLTLRYPMSRELQLRRRTAAGETLYWCQGWARAALRGSQP